MTTTTSHFIKTVCVKDWWLTKEDDNSLRVAGNESEGLQAARVFNSAPIVERLDLFTLRTTDGIFVLLDGFINKEKTCENGFSDEIFKHFLIGFPTNWKESVEKCLQQGIGSKETVDKAKEATIELLDNQNIVSVEESSGDTQSNVQNCNKDRQCCHDGDACLNTNLYDSNVGFRGEGMRYSLRSRGERMRYSLRSRNVPYFDEKIVNKISKSKSFSKKTVTGGGTTTTPAVASLEPQKPAVASLENPQKPAVVSLENPKKPAISSLENHQTLGMAPLCDRISEELTEHPSFAKKEIKQKGNVTKINAEKKNCHDSARPSRACKFKINSKIKTIASKQEPKASERSTPKLQAASSKLEPKASERSTPKLQARRKLSYAEKTPCSKEKESTTPTQSSVIRTSRSGRVILPTLEFWRNQLPIYDDKDHTISGIMEGSAVLKLKRQEIIHQKVSGHLGVAK